MLYEDLKNNLRIIININHRSLNPFYGNTINKNLNKKSGEYQNGENQKIK